MGYLIRGDFPGNKYMFKNRNFRNKVCIKLKVNNSDIGTTTSLTSFLCFYS